jgi:hypothetical protein
MWFQCFVMYLSWCTKTYVFKSRRRIWKESIGTILWWQRRYWKNFILVSTFFFYIENTTISRTENTNSIPNPWARRGNDAATAPPRQTQRQPTGSTNTQSQQQQQVVSKIPTDTADSSSIRWGIWFCGKINLFKKKINLQKNNLSI